MRAGTYIRPVGRFHYLNGLNPVAEGVWKDEWKHATPRWTCCPLYYRRINVRGQMSLSDLRRS